MVKDILFKYCGSSFWNANLTWNTDTPRLTPCFEKTVLIWFPCGFLWVFSCFDVYYTLSNKTRNIPLNWRSYGKFVVLVLLTVTCSVEFFYNLGVIEELFPVDVYTPIIKAVTVAICCGLVFLHRYYGQRSSGILFIFWFLVVFLGFSQFYSELSGNVPRHESGVTRISYIVYYCSSIIMFLLCCMSDLAPLQSDYTMIENPSPEESVSFPSRVTFSWFDSLIYLGFKRPLVSTDIWPLNHQNTSMETFAIFSKHWNVIYDKYTKTDSHNLVRLDEDVNIPDIAESQANSAPSIFPALCKAFGKTYLLAVVLELFELLLTFLSPVLLKCMIGFIEEKEPEWRGYFYASLLLLVNTLKTLFQNQYMRLMEILGLRIKNALTTAIYRKALKLSNSSRKEFTVGDIEILMSVDADMFTHVVYFLNTLWSTPLTIILGLIFLWQLLGPSVLVGLAVMLFLIPVNGFIAKRSESQQSQLMQKASERAKMINEILSGIKVLKLYAWEPSFELQIQKIRGKEINILKKEAYLNAISSLIFSCTPFFISLLTFATYVLSDQENVLDSLKVFVSLSLFNMLDTPLAMVANMTSKMIQISVSMKRISKFLNSEELDLTVVNHDDENNPLVIENGTLSWGIKDEPVLRDINLKVKSGSLVGVVGVVGSGKSSLISAFLGEMYKLSGTVNTKGSIAYVSQLPWIQNLTLQANILFGKPLELQKYQKVLHACALKTDLDILSFGDQTKIGDRGINLSGGQKQRVSLARAIYSDCDIFLLDDPLSAVDSHVGKHIFKNVISSEGILKEKTRLFVTHNVSFLNEVDLIVVVKDKRISEVGTYQELLEKNGTFNSFIKTYSEENNDDLKEFDHELLKQPEICDKEFERKLTFQSSVNNTLHTASQKDELSESSDESEDLRMIEEEQVEVGGVKWAVYSDYFKALGLLPFASAIFFTIANESLVISSSFWLSIWADDKNIIINGTQDTSKRDMYLEVYGLLGLGQAVTTFFCCICWVTGTLNACKLLHSYLLHNIFRSPLSFFETTPQGRVLNRFTKDIEVLDKDIPSIIDEIFAYLLTIIGILIVVSYSTPAFIIAVIPLGLLYYSIQRFYINTSLQIRRLESVSSSPVYSHFGESVSGSSVIRAYQVEERFIKDLEEKVNFNQACSYLSSMAGLWLAVRLQMIGNFIIFFAALFAVISKDSLSAGLVGLSISYTLEITDALDMMMFYATELETDIIAVERIKEYSNTTQEAAWEVSPSPVGVDWPQEGKIEFVDFQVRYREGLDLVLKRLNFTIRAGEKVGIVGRTGAGKSSITLSLFRIIEPAIGKIFVDDVDISKVGLHALRSRLTIIPQDPVLFSGTLRLNLDPFNSHNDDQVWRAIDLARLKPFVQQLPAQLQHKVTGGGGNLSVGQQQLLCLARALLNKTKILILDEATAAVDLETDAFIQKTIRKEFVDCTVLTVAHRINTILDSDRVLVLDEGEVVEFDTPSALLGNRSSIFYGMTFDAGLV